MALPVLVAHEKEIREGPPTSTPSLYAIRSSALRGHRRERAGTVDLTFELSAEYALEPVGDADQRLEVDARLDSLAVQRVDEVLGRDVPGRARRERAAANAADRGVQDGAPASTAAYAFAKPVFRVLCRWTPTGSAELARPRRAGLPGRGRRRRSCPPRRSRRAGGRDLRGERATWPGRPLLRTDSRTTAPIVTVCGSRRRARARRSAAAAATDSATGTPWFRWLSVSVDAKAKCTSSSPVAASRS